MITVVTQKNSQAFAIFVEDKKIIQCMNPLNTYNEILKNLKIPVSNVSIIEMSLIPSTLSTNKRSSTNKHSSIQEAHSKFTEYLDEPYEIENESINFDVNFDVPNLNKYQKYVSIETEIEREKEEYKNTQTETETQSNVPIGNVDMPKLGDLVYVDGVKGILRTITGGVGTVSLINVQEIETEFYHEDDEYNEYDQYQDIILIELVELPGQYFNWNELKEKQNELQTTYGYKPASVL